MPINLNKDLKNSHSQDQGTEILEALREAKAILNQSERLRSLELVDTEAEQLTLSSYFMTTGISLSRLDFFSQPQRPFPDSSRMTLQSWCEKRVQGKPLQHILGTQVFLDHEYEVGPDVLVPRPETEVLLRLAEDRLRMDEPKWGMEIGIGSGVLSIELLVRFPKLRMLASELTAVAQARALQNAKKMLEDGPKGTHRLKIVLANSPLDVWEPFESFLAPRSADFLITNPPYLSSGDEVDFEVAHYEPHEALFAPPQDSLHFYRAISSKASFWLRPGGMIFAEVPHERAQEILTLFSVSAGFRDVQLFPDLTGRLRVLIAKRGEN